MLELNYEGRMGDSHLSQFGQFGQFATRGHGGGIPNANANGYPNHSIRYCETHGEIAKESSQAGDTVVVKQADFPKWVGLIYKAEDDPGQVTIERGREGEFVQILYGGGFGNWGLAVGSPTLVLTNHDNVHNDLWKPGIYFWSAP